MYDPAKIEGEVLRYWQEHDIFNKVKAKNKENPNFSFIDGPITANNPMGVHHAWGRTYKDMYPRFRAMQGFNQRFQPGFDCQGLWVEVEVEKELGFNSKRDIMNFGLDKFSEACKARVEKYSKIQIEQSKKLGMMMDWENPYFTHSDNNIEHIWHFLKVCHEKGWLYRGGNVMPWCNRCGTSLSQHEMADSYKEITHKAVYVKFKLKNEDACLLVWTTTPWTLSSNVGAAVNEGADYVVADNNGEKLYLSKVAADRLGLKYGKELKGKDLVGKEYEHLFDFEKQLGVEHKIIPWDEVGEDEGTGIVHIAPGCGQEDNVLGKIHDLAVICPLDEYGDYVDGFGFLTGKNVKEAYELISSDLAKRGLFFKAEEHRHRYPICWRCKEELVFRFVEEWFISTDEVRPLLKEAAKEVEWQPEHAGKLMQDWLDNMRDWCISRKRFWGLPLPIWECNCGHVEIIGSKKELYEKAASGTDNLNELHRPWIDKVTVKCSKCGAQAKRIEDVGDCWLDAGIVPFSTIDYMKDKKQWAKWYPADLVIEMREQVRLWFYSLMFMGVTLEGKSPYKKVLAYEKVHDENGKPMHKSSGNAIWFDDAVDKMGADVMRWIYVMQNPKENVQFGFNVANETKKRLNVLSNVADYLLTYKKFAAQKHDDNSKESKWIISRLNTVIQKATQYIESLEPNKAAVMIEDFFLEDLSRGYIQYTRDHFKQKDGQAIKTLMVVFEKLLRLMAPMVPFLSEHLYRKVYGTESVHLCSWPVPEESLPELEEQMKIIQEIMKTAQHSREQTGYGIRWPLRSILVVTTYDKVRAAVKEHEGLLLNQLNVKKIELSDNDPEGVTAIFKVNFRKLGEDYGTRTGDIAANLKGAQGVIDAINTEGRYYVKVDGEDYEILEHHLEISKNTPESLTMAECKYGTLYADKTRDEQIDMEGYTREVIRRIQQLRKESELSNEDKIKLCVISEVNVDMEMVMKAVNAESQISLEECKHNAEMKVKGKEMKVGFSLIG